LPADLLQPGAVAVYAIEELNQRGRSSGLSNRVRVSLAPGPAVPQNFVAEVVADGVRLSWSTESASGAPTNTFAVNRQSQEDPRDAVTISVPAAASPRISFVDKKVNWEKNYTYSVHAVARVNGIDLISDETTPVKVVTHDIFPPAAPTGAQAVFSGDRQQLFVDLTWNLNTERDLAGYNVYRTDSSGSSKKLNVQIVPTPSFRDVSVAAGETYLYSVTAVDIHANESLQSATAKETVPK
jgi:hypothetical protein